jgi:hypothetical protein
MALDVTTSELVIDESIGTGSDAAKTDDDYSGAIPTALTDLGTPIELAFQADFLTVTSAADETVTGVKLSAPGGGDIPAGGVLTTLKTIEGEAITLFQGSGGVVEGRTAGGDVAFAILLVNNKDLYVAQYIALEHPDTTDSDDRIDLTGYISASVTATQPVTFSQIKDAASGNEDWYIVDADAAGGGQLLISSYVEDGSRGTVNVSEQGIGVASQSVAPGRALQIDIINGGTQSADDFSATGPTYGAHIENVSRAGFTISQTNPNGEVVDLTISAFNESGNDKGTNFESDAVGTPVNITGLIFIQGTTILTDTQVAALGITFNLNGDIATVFNVPKGITIDFTTAGGAGGTFDRFVVSNIEPTAPNAGGDTFDIREFHYLGERTNAYKEDVGAAINFDDDGPTIDLSGTVPDLVVDESELAVIGSAPDADGAKAVQDFAGAFTSGYGTDGSGTISYKLEVTDGTGSGLTDTASGQSVLLYQDGDDKVVGKTETGGDVVFTLTLTGSSVTLEQHRAVQHADTTDPDDQTTLSAADLIRLVATIKDFEGDEDSETLGIGQHLIFKDDGPSVVVTAGEVKLETDESYLATGSAGADLTKTKVTASYVDLFEATYGSDGAGGWTGFALGIKAGVTDSGLTACINGTDEKILLSKDTDGNIIGTTETSNTEVFKISVDGDGKVTLEQLAAVHHGNPATSPATDDAVSFANDLITLSAQASDKEGDLSDAATANIGSTFVFHDDTPTIGADDAATVAFTSGQSVEGTTGGVDGADTATVALTSYTDLAGFFEQKVGNTVSYFKGTDNTGEKWFEFTVDEDGNYTFDVLKTGLSEGESVDFARIKGGQPVEKLTASTKFDNAQITFDGRIFTPGTSGTFTDKFVNSTTKNVDDINPDNLGFGIMGSNPNQASQINNNEAFIAKIGESADFFQFDIQGIGNNAIGVHLDYSLVKDNNNNGVYDSGDTLVQSATNERYEVKSGAAATTVKIDPTQDFDLVYMRFHFEKDDLQNGANLTKTQVTQAVDNAGIRVQNFAIKTIDTIAEYDLDFGMKRTDCDDDATSEMHARIHVDPDVLPSVNPVNPDLII